MLQLRNDIHEQAAELAQQYYHSNLPAGKDPVSLSLRSFRQMQVRLGAENLYTQYQYWSSQYSVADSLVSYTEWEEQRELAVNELQLPYFELHLSFSNPVCNPHCLSVGSLLKLYDGQMQQQAKIKIAGFCDVAGKLWWEVGFVHRRKTLEQKTVFSGGRHTYFLLRKLVDKTVSFMQKRKDVCGIHLTPAYYHVWPLSRRITSAYPDHILEEPDPDWLKDVTIAFQQQRENAPLKYSQATENFEISRLLEAGRLLHPQTAKPMQWKAPLIIILPEK